jgi:hypothetical protein
MPLAFIHWIGDGEAPPRPPLGYWGAGGGFPTNPIVVPPGGAYPNPPQPPDGFWGAGGGFPTNPIVVPPGGAYPKPPDGFWGAGSGFPTNPIVIPKPPNTPVDPDYGIDENVGFLRPSHPIALPPAAIEGGFWLAVYIPGVGWEWISFKPGSPKPPSGIAVPKK